MRLSLIRFKKPYLSNETAMGTDAIYVFTVVALWLVHSATLQLLD